VLTTRLSPSLTTKTTQRRAVVTAALAARASAAAAATASAAEGASAASSSRAALPALLLLLQQQPRGISSSSRNKQHPWSSAASSSPPLAATPTRSFASASTTTDNNSNNDPIASRGKPTPNITDAQFTSEQEQRQQRAHQAAALRASMDALVDGAVEAVERGELSKAVEVLERGLNVLASEHGQAPELGELHNQAALLLLLQSSGGGQEGAEEGGGEDGTQPSQNPLARAADHATQALRLTERAFGAAHPLTGHRLLRLGTIRLAQGRAADAAPLLAAAADMLGGGGGGGEGGNGNGSGSGNTAFGPGLAEARFHLSLLPVGSARQASAVAAAEEPLTSSLAELVSLLGPDSMIVRLALAQHSAAVGRGLEHAAVLMGGGGSTSPTSSSSGSSASLALSEALLKQHARLQELRDRGSAELGLARYQLAVLYYSHDLLIDSGSALRQAREVLASHIPAGHDVDHLMRHRAGMIAAASGDARSGEQLLKVSRDHYASQAREMVAGGDSASGSTPTHPLQREADFGLALCKLRALETTSGESAGEKAATVASLLDEAAAARRDVARSLGASHLLSLGAARHEARARVMAQEKFGGGKR
jgi:hypothetical protein